MAEVRGAGRGRIERFNPIALEILSNKVSAATDQMAATLQRSARSTFVKEAADFGTGLVDPSGRVFAYPSSASVQFLIDSDCGPTIRAVPDVEPGDVIVTNDPYTSEGLASHMPDLHMLRPYFHKGRVVCYGWCYIHCTDIGGAVPSSISPSNREIFQEGIRIPPLKAVRKGVFNPDFVALFTANSRTPEMNLGDVRAMVGCLETGARRVAEMIERHGIDTVFACPDALQDYSALKSRQVLRRLPDGKYDFWDYMDDDLVSSIPVRLRVRMRVDDGRVNFDFTGTDPQVDAAYNIATAGKRHHWLTVRLTGFMLTHDPTMPLNAGLFRHITVTSPPGTIINAQFPAAVGIRHATGRRLTDAMTGAMLKAAPESVAAPTCGATVPFVLAETDPRTGKRRLMVIEPLRGGMGAWNGGDGVDARDATTSNLNNHPIEVVEEEAGVIVREYDVPIDSGGPGQWRGGTGQMLTIEVLRDGGTILARGMERMRFPPYGVAGGRPGAPFRAVFNKGRADERPLAKIDQLAVGAGDTVTFMLPGASGYGNPYRRPPAKVLEDVMMGFVSLAAAESEYGVVIVKGHVDAAATRRRRAGRRAARPGFAFGAEREAWETVFDDAIMEELNRRLFLLPPSLRSATRRRIFAHAVPDLPPVGSTPLAKVLADADEARARLRSAMDEFLGPTAGRAPPRPLRRVGPGPWHSRCGE